MTRKSLVPLALGAALLAFALPAAAQRGPMGSIKGRITDEKGVPLSGAYLYLTSTESLGMANYMTPKSGLFGFVGLVPGKFKLVTEKAGYKTVTVDGIVVSAGATFTANIKLSPSAIEDEPSTAQPGTGLDRESARYAVILNRDIAARLPLGRDISSILGLVPGLVFETDPISDRFSVNGMPYTSSIVVQDDIILSGPVDGRFLNRISTDFVDEIVVDAAGHTADIGPGQGAYINIIHRAGSPRTEGSLFYSASGKGLTNSLWTADELEEMPNAAPTALRREHDLSFTLGGPVLKDMAWMLANIHFTSLGRTAPFNYWTDPTGVRHFVYDYSEKSLSGMFKLSMDVMDKFKGVVEVGFGGLREPIYEPDVDPLRPEASTRNLDGDRTLLARLGGSYVVGQHMRVDLSLGYAKDRKPLLLNDMAKAKPEYEDLITGYSWGSGSLNDRETASRMKIGIALSRIQDGWLGTFHELVAGGEYETTKASSSTWKADNLIYNYVDGSPYTFGRTTSPLSGEEVGYGVVGFYIAPAGENMSLSRELKRIGAFVQDRIKIGGRLSLSAGFRFDRSEALFGQFSKGTAGNSVSVNLGNTLIAPILGYNLYSSISLPQWDKAIVWSEISPRFGLSFDLLGGGRTILKASWARLPEYLGLGYSQDLAQVDPTASHDFVWYDEDANGMVNAADVYKLVPYDFRVYRTEFLKQAVDPELSAPVIEEWTAGIDQAVGRDFTLSARYIDRRHTNLTGHVVYDPSTGAHWWRVEEAPEGWWVPFSTTVPGTDGYEDVALDLYLPATDAPDYFERIENVPELKARYRSVEARVPQEDVAQLAALRLPDPEPRDRDDHHGLELERREFSRSADAELVHQHRRDRPPLSGPPLRGPAGRDGPLGLGPLRQRPLQGPERRPLGPDGDRPPAGRLGRGQRRRRDPGDGLPGEPRLAALRLVEEPGLPAGKGVRPARPQPLRGLVRRFQPARGHLPDPRPQRRRDVGPGRRGRQHRHTGPQRHLRDVYPAVGLTGRPPELQPKILAGTPPPSSAPRPRSCT